jgi:hypothetical protein
MKKLLFILMLCLSATLSAQETAKTGLYYCVQVMSTENPELLRPGHFSMMYEPAMVEVAEVNGKKYYRILFIYESVEEQDGALHNWKHQYKNAIRVTRNKQQISKMYKLFSHV